VGASLGGTSGVGPSGERRGGGDGCRCDHGGRRGTGGCTQGEVLRVLAEAYLRPTWPSTCMLLAHGRDATTVGAGGRGGGGRGHGGGCTTAAAGCAAVGAVVGEAVQGVAVGVRL
jgi:hypothetical protein